ncbi:MAG: CTP synthase [Pelagibacteraceae bacterium]|jgi:CTP synthase|nr:CTP synthase [Pelagibacteraceae bacterium]HJO13941.1 CTP synthase [Alphaproteobacteria bacterium]MBO6466286.1 CTP synthase [Pelagibacteraceae bacterium]MBO6468120.1 CTP synthase [Pelagibacteraceae bacterium]MBO6469377.1 CTP synthase [Pelagibacteraceae bacterium]
MHYVFITGGVSSSLGKGLASAALASLLQLRNFKVRIRKLDPYLNVDPGTMSPYQHGEVFVTDDGAETDLDLGHYERFTNVSAKKSDSVSSGKIYSNVLKKERKGEYLGATIQVIPHVTDEIKNFIHSDLNNEDIVIYEIGGTVGDIESLPFLEAIRQIRNDRKISSLLIHMTYVPYISSADELKTKPTQHSVKELLNAGIQPDIIMCRCEKEIDQEALNKISLFCNVKNSNVIPALNASSIYEVPSLYSKAGLDKVLLKELGYIEKKNSLDLSAWNNVVKKIHNTLNKVTVGVVGKYTDLKDSYKSLNEALIHGGFQNNTKVDIDWINSEKLSEEDILSKLSNVQGILVPGGFGKRGIDGKISSIKFAREKNIPFFGICLGMQLAVIEIARNVLNLIDANSSEFGKTNNKVVGLMTEWIQNNIKMKRTEKSDKGGTMRLGSYPCQIQKGSLINKIYGSLKISERHRHRYEVNTEYMDKFREKGFIYSGMSPDNLLPEILESKNHNWFIGVQFHPELKSRPQNPHPLFISFTEACIRKE